MEIAKIAWLAGIIDGEGSIGIYSSKPKTYHAPSYTTQVIVSNDNTSIIEETLEVMSAIVGRELKVVYDWRNERRFVHYKVRVTKRLDVLKILTAVAPYLIGKKAQAQVLIRLLQNHIKGTRYSRIELQVIDVLKHMKHTNKTETCADGNTVPMRESNDSQKCVTTLQQATLFSDGEVEDKV